LPLTAGEDAVKVVFGSLLQVMSITLFALWIGLSASLLLLFVYAAVINLRHRQHRQVGLDEILSSFLPVDVDSFLALIQPEANQQAGPKLSRKEFYEKSRQTIDCLRRMTHNAALLQKLGYGYLNCGNQLISDLAQQMIDAGVHVRLYTFVGLAALHARHALRFAAIDILPADKLAKLERMMKDGLIPAYHQLKDKAGDMACLKFSGLHDALTDSL
jgi:hypothetical protein